MKRSGNSNTPVPGGLELRLSCWRSASMLRTEAKSINPFGQGPGVELSRYATLKNRSTHSLCKNGFCETKPTSTHVSKQMIPVRAPETRPAPRAIPLGRSQDPRLSPRLWPMEGAACTAVPAPYREPPKGGSGHGVLVGNTGRW